VWASIVDAPAGSVKQVLSVSFIVNIFQCTELQEVRGPVHLAVVLLGVGQLQPILHALTVLDTLEVVVPTAHIWHHIEAHEPVSRDNSHTSDMEASAAACTKTQQAS